MEDLYKQFFDEIIKIDKEYRRKTKELEKNAPESIITRMHKNKDNQLNRHLF